MASSPAYGDRPPLQGFRRSFTVPHRQLSHHERAALSDADAGSETLYTHPSVKVVSFSPPLESIVSKSSATHADADYPIDTIETLPWRSRTENPMASGRMVIEKVRGSSWFLKCPGTQFVHPILRNSQCWCVDGESKFVLRKGRLQYYRIELPATTDEDKAKVEELKGALAKVLKFEKTPCPFKRAFHVDLPDDAITPRRKGKWTRKEGLLPDTPDTDTPPLRMTKGARSWSMQAQAVPVPESRRQSDYDFARRLYPTPPRRETTAGLRPDTPSSTASSEELASQGQQEDYSDSGSSMDESASAQEEDVPTEDQNPSAEADNNDTGLEETSEAQSHVVEDISSVIPSKHPAEPEKETEKVQKDVFPPTTPEANREHEDSSADVNHIELKPAEIKSSRDDIMNEEPTESETFEVEVVADGVEPEEPVGDPRSQEEPDQEPAPLQDPETSLVFDLNEAEPSEPQPKEPEQSNIVEHESDEDPEVLESHGAKDDYLADDLPPRPTEPKEPDQVTAQENVEVLTEPALADDVPDDTASIASTTESFHTLASEDHALSPSAMSLQAPPETVRLDPASMRQFQHKRGISELTVTASNFDGQNEFDQLERFVTTEEAADRPTTPRLIQSSASDESWPDVNTPASNIQDGLRHRLKSRRSLSPLAPSSNVFTPQAPNPGNHMTSVLLQKACSLALVKPIEVVMLIVHILTRIAGGASLNDLLTGELFKKPDQRRRNSSFPDRITPQQDDEEDDFGVPIRGRTRSSEMNATNAGHDTDADSLFDLD